MITEERACQFVEALKVLGQAFASLGLAPSAAVLQTSLVEALRGLDQAYREQFGPFELEEAPADG